MSKKSCSSGPVASCVRLTFGIILKKEQQWRNWPTTKDKGITASILSPRPFDSPSVGNDDQNASTWLAAGIVGCTWHFVGFPSGQIMPVNVCWSVPFSQELPSADLNWIFAFGSHVSVAIPACCSEPVPLTRNWSTYLETEVFLKMTLFIKWDRFF